MDLLKSFFAAFAFVGLIVFFMALKTSAGENQTNYFNAVIQELTRLDINAVCQEKTACCYFEKTIQLSSSKKTHKYIIQYDEKTKTITITLENFITLTQGSPPSLELARHLLKLNNELVTAKLNWNKAASEINLTAVINTDTNFDRQAFRSQVTSLIKIAKVLSSDSVLF